MDTLGIFLAQAFLRSTAKTHLPEIRKVELSYNARQGVSVLPFLQTAPEAEPFPGFLAPLDIFGILNDYFVFLNPDFESISSWERYCKLPKTSRSEKILAEFYRILRVYFLVCTHQEGRIEEKPEEGLILLNLPETSVVYTAHLSPIALELLCSAVTYYLFSLKRPDPEAYVEAMLSSYYKDVADHISFFCDEGSNIYQFQMTFHMNRHLRLIGGNAPIQMDTEFVFFELEDFHQDALRYPIDIYFKIERQMYVVPVEALTNNKLPRIELERWKAKEVSHG